MKKRKHNTEPTGGTTYNHIPDIEIIDLELDGNTDLSEPIVVKEVPDTISRDDIITEEAYEISEDAIAAEHQSSKKNWKDWRSYMNMHVLLLAVFIIFVFAIIAKFSNWGIFVDINDIQSDHSAGYLDVLDQFLPLVDSTGMPVETDVVDNIVVFGNAPFADNRDSEDNLANMIAEASGAKVYNCSVSGSYLAFRSYFFDSSSYPMDAYGFYWLATLASNGANAHYYPEAETALGADLPPEAKEVYETLTTLDFNTVDVVVVMYDASDYLMGHEMYDDLNPTNVQTFTGNLEAGIEMLQTTYPHIRIIVMSPTYAYALNEDGEYVSSDMYRYGQDVLSTYVIKESDSSASRSVSFIDHLYGTITESNADKYLTDHLHLNVKGRELVAERFMDALTAYSTIHK